MQSWLTKVPWEMQMQSWLTKVPQQFWKLSRQSITRLWSVPFAFNSYASQSQRHAGIVSAGFVW